MVTIRRIQVGEAALFKQMRLASLRDAPYAFSATFESAIRRSAKSWQEQADSTGQGTDRATFLAFSGELPVGISALYRLEGQVDVGELLQVWVAPDYRGSRVAWDLLDAIFTWAKVNNFNKVIATVADGNHRALKFYSRYGFSRMEDPSLFISTGVRLAKEVE